MNRILKEAFTISGRARRSEWWLISIGLSIVASILSAVVSGVLFGRVVPDGGAYEVDPELSTVRLIASLAIFWPVTALSIKRAHDRNSPGYGVLLYQLTNIVLAVAAVAAAWGFLPSAVFEHGAYLAFWIVFLLWSLFLLVTLGFLDGTKGPNRYGASPKGVRQKSYQAPAV
jgi:uncharacterized membrane protein YhaH (DUF805 family)